MADNGQDFELLSFIWARYPYKLSQYTIDRRFIVFSFADSKLYKALTHPADPADPADPPDPTFYEELTRPAKPAARRQYAETYKCNPDKSGKCKPYESGVDGFVSGIDILDWHYVNLFLLQEWLQDPTPAKERIPDEAWAIAENIIEHPLPESPPPLPPSAKTSAIEPVTGPKEGENNQDTTASGDPYDTPVKAKAEYIRCHMAAFQEAGEQGGDCVAALRALIDCVLNESMATFVKAKNIHFQSTFNALWQSLFALVVLPSDKVPLLPSRIVLMLRIVNLVDRLAREPPDPTLGGSDSAAAIWDAVHATPVLPAKAFPLPPSPGSPDKPILSPASADSPGKDHDQTKKTDAWLQPMAVGELKRVRQRLHHYELGEIAQIENVLRGEVKETDLSA